MTKFPSIVNMVSNEVNTMSEFDELVESGRFDEIIEPEMMRVSDSERWWEYGPNAGAFAKSWKKEVLFSVRKQLVESGIT